MQTRGQFLRLRVSVSSVYSLFTYQCRTKMDVDIDDRRLIGFNTMLRMSAVDKAPVVSSFCALTFGNIFLQKLTKLT